MKRLERIFLRVQVNWTFEKTIIGLMNKETTILIIILAVLATIIVSVVTVITVRRRIKEKRTSYVKETSLRYARILELNRTSSFHDIDPKITFRKYCGSKREFDRLDKRDYLRECIGSCALVYQELLRDVSDNIRRYREYLDHYSEILATTPYDEKLYTENKYYRSMEQELCENEKLKPVTKLDVWVEKSYISPQGRNRYKDSSHYDAHDINLCLQEIRTRRAVSETAKYQRSLMTDSLRYDVMKRDGFRCVLCGASSKDGVRLHVDHIKPISKGGKTEMSNLRTLCERCNMGKRDKYDTFGLN